jgi:hypothetical protein
MMSHCFWYEFCCFLNVEMGNIELKALAMLILIV